MKRRMWLWSVMALSIVASTVYLKYWETGPYRREDSAGFAMVARDIVEGRSEPSIRTPGYPLLLVMTGASQTAGPPLLATQIALHMLAVLMVCACLRSVGVSQGGVVLAGAIGVLPPFAQSASLVMTECLAQFCLVAAVATLQAYLIERRRGWLVASSVAFGYAALTKPSMQLAAIAVAGALYLLGRFRVFDGLRAVEAIGLVAGTVAIVGSYGVYHQIKFGNPGTMSTLGNNLANLGPELYPEIPDPVTRRLLVEARNESLARTNSVTWAHYNAHERLRAELGLTPEQVEPWLRHQMTKAILAHPVQYAEIVASSYARFWFPVSGRMPLMKESRLRNLWYALDLAIMAVLAVEFWLGVAWLTAAAAGVGFGDGTRLAWRLWTVSATVVLYNAVISCALEVGETRYRTATELLLIAMAGSGWVAGRGLWRDLGRLRSPVSKLREG